MTRKEFELVGELAPMDVQIAPLDVHVDLFDRHDADGDAIIAHAARLDRQAGDVDHFDARLTSEHHTAQHGVAGILTTMLDGADKPTKAAGRRLVQRTVSAAATLTLFGHQVNDFNRHVREWNDQIRARETRKGQLEERERLRPRYRQAAELMEDRVTTAARLLRHPLDARTIKKLHRVGVLPLGIENLFPSVRLTARERAESVQNRIERGFLPDVARMLPADLDAWLRKHPDVAAAVPALLPVARPSAAVQALAGALARQASSLVKRGLEAEPGPDALRLIERGTQQLSQIMEATGRDGDRDDDGDHAGRGNRDLSGGGEAYVEAFLDDLGADGLAGLSGSVDAALDAGGHHDAGHGGTGDLPQRPREHTAPVADAILALTRSGTGEAPAHIKDLPESVRELLAVRPGTEADEQTLRGWSDLLDSAPRGSEPGGPFAYRLAEQAIESKVAIGDDGDRYLSDLLSVSARSENGSSRVLLDDDLRPSLLNADWDWQGSEGARDLIRAGTDRHEDGGGHVERQAEAAHVLMTEVAADPRGTVDRLGEPMQGAVIGVGLRWADSFGLSGGPGDASGVVLRGPDAIGPDAGPRVQLSDDQVRGFMDYAAHSGPWDSARFSSGLAHHADRMLAEALDPRSDAGPHERADALKSALAWAGTAEGRMHAASNDVPNADGRWTAALLDAADRSPWIPAGAPEAGERPRFEAELVPWESARDRFAPVEPDVAAAQDYRFASLVADRYADHPAYAGLYDRDGGLRPLSALSDVERRQLGNLADNLLEDFNERHPRVDDVTMAAYREAYTAVSATAR